MAQNTNATLIANPVRPNDDTDPIASAFANEIKGGLHGYATKAEMYAIIQARREWGMMCAVYNDGTATNNAVWILKRGQSSTSITDNSNWVKTPMVAGANGTGAIDPGTPAGGGGSAPTYGSITCGVYYTGSSGAKSVFNPIPGGKNVTVKYVKIDKLITASFRGVFTRSQLQNIQYAMAVDLKPLPGVIDPAYKAIGTFNFQLSSQSSLNDSTINHVSQGPVGTLYAGQYSNNNGESWMYLPPPGSYILYGGPDPTWEDILDQLNNMYPNRSYLAIGGQVTYKIL